MSESLASAGGVGMSRREISFADVLRSASFRFATWTVAVLILAAAAIFAVLFWQTNALITDQTVASLDADARAVVQAGRSGGMGAMAEAVRARSIAGLPSLYHLADASGRYVAGNLPVMPGVADGRGSLFHYRISGDGPQRLAVAVRHDAVGGGSLLVGRDIEDQRRYAARMSRAFLIGFGLLAFAGLVGGYAISRLVLGRIGTITTTSASIMAGDLSRRVPLAGSGDEFDGLAANLNAMLERIELLMTGLREVSDNIAHDLKTPLNRLRNRAEAALRDGQGEAGYREGLERIIEGADDLIKTFNALLLIARLEAGAVEQTAITADVGALVRDVAELYEPVAEECGLDIALDVPEGQVLARVNRELIGQAVANLLDNAIKYSRCPSEGGASADAGGGAISVAVAVRAGVCEIRVGDRGSGIPPGERERALRRFVRLDASRTAPGTGLGLSLVAAVMRLHGGSVRLEDNRPGLLAVLVFPQRQAEA